MYFVWPCVSMSWSLYRDGRAASRRESVFYFYHMGLKGFELRLSGLVASTLTDHTISPAWTFPLKILRSGIQHPLVLGPLPWDG